MVQAISPAGEMARGTTWYGGATIDTANYGTSISKEGSLAVFKDIDPVTRQPRSGRLVTCVLVRNVSGVNLVPGYGTQWQAGFWGKRVIGYSNNAGAALPLKMAGIVDDHLPAAGVPNGDLFWLVVDGPVLCVTAAPSDGQLTLAEGDPLVGASAAASTSNTTAGRVNGAVSGGATSAGFMALLNLVGRAMSSNASTQTGRSILVDVKLL